MKYFVAIATAVLLTAPAAWGGSVAINPDTGWSGTFLWLDGKGWIDGIEWDVSKTYWTVTLAAAGNMTLVTAQDSQMPGDKFALYVDNVMRPWTVVTYDSFGRFQAEYHNLPLSAGTHRIDLYVTDLAKDPATGSEYSGGFANASFSSVYSWQPDPFQPEPNPGPDQGVIPEPLTMLGMFMGVSGLTGYIRRRKMA